MDVVDYSTKNLKNFMEERLCSHKHDCNFQRFLNN